MAPTFDQGLADRWQDMMARWESNSAEVTALVRALEQEPDARKHLALSARLREQQLALAALRLEIDAMVKRAAKARTSTGDDFTVATVYSLGDVSDKITPRRQQGRRFSRAE